MSELCPTVAEVQDSTEASHAFACRKRPSHSEGHEPPAWANRMLLEPERLRWTATDPARATAIREGPFFIREFDADDTLVEALEAPTRRDAVQIAYARAARMPTQHWLGWAPLRRGAPVIGFHSPRSRYRRTFYAGVTETDGRWALRHRRPGFFEKEERDPSGLFGCECEPSAAVGHLERGCSTAERHIDLLREGYGISKIRSHLTELSDHEVVASEYGHREAAFR